MRCLSRLFTAAAFKRLGSRDVKINPRSGHVLLDAQPLVALFGSYARKAIPAGIYWFNDEGDAIRNEAMLRWSKQHRTDEVPSHLAFPTGEVSESMHADHGIVIATMRRGPAVLAVVRAESTIENQLCWLFGMANISRDKAFVVRRFPADHDTALDYAPNYILRELFIDPDPPRPLLRRTAVDEPSPPSPPPA